MPSFDIVSQVSSMEIENAVNTAKKELANRFDFKGSDARVEQKERELTAFADDEFKLSQVRDVLHGKFAKRGVDARFLKIDDPEKIGGDKLKQAVKVKSGIEGELAKKIQSLIKQSKIKVQAAIQGDAVRVWVNACPHVGTPLDWTPDKFMSRDGRHIVCATHGALFSPETGECVQGPRRGDYIDAVAAEIRDGVVYVPADAGL